MKSNPKARFFPEPGTVRGVSFNLEDVMARIHAAANPESSSTTPVPVTPFPARSSRDAQRSPVAASSPEVGAHA